MRFKWMAVMGLLLAAETECDPTGKGWDYRWGIRKDFEAKTRTEGCPRGKHWEKARCPAEVAPSDCPVLCMPDESAR